MSSISTDLRTAKSLAKKREHLIQKPIILKVIMVVNPICLYQQLTMYHHKIFIQRQVLLVKLIKLNKTSLNLYQKTKIYKNLKQI